MAEQEVPLLQEAEPEAEQTEGNEGEAPAEAGVQGPVLDVDMIISRLLSYKDKPGKQVEIKHICNPFTFTATPYPAKGEFTREPDSSALCKVAGCVSLSTDATGTGGTTGHLWGPARTV